MKKSVVMLAVLAFTNSVFAAEIPLQPPLLDKVVFQLSARQWVSTETALLNVNINITLNNANLVQARAEIMDKLNKIGKGEWHLTQFDRSQDSSGLEKLYVQAESRVNQGSLTDIYQNAKAVSKPGASYEIAGIEFKPSLEEKQQAKAQLREKLYQQANAELTRLNKVYVGQNYTLYRLNFEEDYVEPQPKALRAQEMNTMAMSVPAPPLSVSSEINMNVQVELAANRSQGN